MGGKFININSAGKFSMRVPKGTEGAVDRINKENKEVSELFFDFFTGTLKDIQVKEGSYGKQWEFKFDANGELYTLQLSYSNSFAKNILKMIQNVDVTKPFTMSPKAEMVDGKNKTSLFINQDGTPVKHSYTKENPNGMPPMKQIKVKGQIAWDDTEAIEFLENMAKTVILPQLGHVQSEVVVGLDDIKTKAEADAEDIPF